VVVAVVSAVVSAAAVVAQARVAVQAAVAAQMQVVVAAVQVQVLLHVTQTLGLGQGLLPLQEQLLPLPLREQAWVAKDLLVAILSLDG